VPASAPCGLRDLAPVGSLVSQDRRTEGRVRTGNDDQSRPVEDRLSLSRDLDLLADRIAGQGATRRAHELKAVAAMLRDKAAEPSQPEPEAREARRRVDDYLLAAALLAGWLVVVLAVVALAAPALGVRAGG